MKTFAALAAVVILLLTHHQCSRTIRVKVIVPAGFRGIFVISERESIGEKVSGTGSYDAVFVIPPGAVLYVNDASAFQRWHIIDAEFSDGKLLSRLPEFAADGTEKKSVRLFEVQADADGNFHFLVGTVDEYQNHDRLRRPEILD